MLRSNVMVPTVIRRWSRVLILAVFCLAAQAQQADTIYFNGKIITMWDQHPTVEAVAIEGDRFWPWAAMQRY